MKNLQAIIEAGLGGARQDNPENQGARSARPLRPRLNMLDSGEARVAEKVAAPMMRNGSPTSGSRKPCSSPSASMTWHSPAAAPANPNGGTRCRQNSRAGPPRISGQAGFRAVPNCIVRHSAYIAPGAILMPSFVNLGAYVDKGTMVDTWVTVGSCAQIGKNVHLSGGVGIGGVLEPMQAGPTIIEDNCFIGARSEVVEGVVVGEGSVISMGVFIGQSTKIIDRATGEVFMGRVPPYSVVVSGSLPQKPYADGSPSPSLYCAVIVKRVDEKTRSKTSINELLRD